VTDGQGVGSFFKKALLRAFFLFFFLSFCHLTRTAFRLGMADSEAFLIIHTGSTVFKVGLLFRKKRKKKAKKQKLNPPLFLFRR
jgi:hypothetical protein